MFISLLSLLFFSCSNNKGEEKKPNATVEAAFSYHALSQNQKDYYQQQIQPLYNNLLGNGFSGGILVAKNGEIVFEDYKGYVNYAKQEPMTINTPCHIASVSKTFTAMMVLKLMEQSKIDITADVRTYLPNFPYQNISVKDLLDHRSGLPNYVHIMDGKTTQVFYKKGRRGRLIKYTKTVKDNSVKEGLITNADVLQFLIDKHPAVEALPNRRFHYCNTNFALLALIIEKIAGVDFPTYMKQNLFDPLGMKDTYVFSIKDTAKYTPSYKYNYAPYGIEKLDCVYGDKNIYSTPRDLLLWDKALYSNSFISKQTLQLAYMPNSFERAGNHNYGLGWRLFTYPNYTIPYHNGWWHGNNAVFTRLTNDTATVIVLGNKYNPRIYRAKTLASVFASNAPVADTMQTEE